MPFTKQIIFSDFSIACICTEITSAPNEHNLKIRIVHKSTAEVAVLFLFLIFLVQQQRQLSMSDGQNRLTQHNRTANRMLFIIIIIISEICKSKIESFSLKIDNVVRSKNGIYYTENVRRH